VAADSGQRQARRRAALRNLRPGQRGLGKPSRPDFLLAPGELLQVCAGWNIVAYEHGQLRQPDRVVQRIAAIRPSAEDVQGPALPRA
jgi:hypothetical protein